MKERITKLQQQWEYLVQKSGEKSQHLKESNQQQQFNTNVKELDFWLGEVRDEWLQYGDCLCCCLVFLDVEDFGYSFFCSQRKMSPINSVN